MIWTVTMINNNLAENKIENGFLIMKAAFLSYQYSCNMIENYNKNDDLKKISKNETFYTLKLSYI